MAIQNMTQKTRLEINIRRLLSQCELLAKEDSNVDWKLEMYIEAVQDMIEKLQTTPGKPCRDIMVKYIKRVDFLKGVLNTKKLTNPVERVNAAQLLPINIISTNEAIDGPSITTQIHQKTTAKYGQEVRDELFKSNLDDGTRKRLFGSNDDSQDIDSILKQDREAQEKIAENMISLTRNMKEQAMTASAIIKKDVSLLEKSDDLTDQNTTRLKGESVKLEEHTKSNWRCWTWLMLAFVIVVYMNMIIFIIVKKKRA